MLAVAGGYDVERVHVVAHGKLMSVTVGVSVGGWVVRVCSALL